MAQNAKDNGNKVTLDDVAAVAGLSKATVSKALNSRNDVSVKTRIKVRQVAKQIGYVNSTSPVSTQYPSIALVTDTMETVYTLQVLNGAVTEAMRERVSVATTYVQDVRGQGETHPLTPEWLRMIASCGYIGLILVTTEVPIEAVELARELGVPLVAVDPRNPLPPDVLSIGGTNWNGGLDAAQHLLDLGHTRIEYVKGPPKSIPSVERFQGFLSAHQMAGIEIDRSLVLGDDFTFRAGLTAARKLLALPEKNQPTAFVAGSDWSALGVIEAAREAGLRVPQDVSVVGFDDTILATSSAPRLTTVRQPLREMGALAVRTILGVHAQVESAGPMLLQTHLVVRDSTTVPRPGRTKR